MVTYAGLTVVGGTVITSVWGNMMRDAGIIPFSTAADRTTAIAAPNNGQLTYRSGVGQYESYISAATSWVPLPGTIIARAARSTDSSTTTTEVGVLRLDSIPIVNGAFYVIETSSMYLLSTTGDILNIRFRSNTAGAATTASPQLGQAAQITTNSIQPYTTKLSATYASATTGSLSVLLSITRASGSGNAKVFGSSEFWVRVGNIIDPGDTGVDI
jgi:hypothetical protein